MWKSDHAPGNQLVHQNGEIHNVSTKLFDFSAECIVLELELYLFTFILKTRTELYKALVFISIFFKFICQMYFQAYLINYSTILFKTNLLHKTFGSFIMYSNKIFPITDLPRGLGLNCVSLVYIPVAYLKDGTKKCP